MGYTRPETEVALRSLLEEQGDVVPRRKLNEAPWPEGGATPSSSTLTIHTIRTQGFLVEASGCDTEGMTWLTS
jgi:hypothetical protein